MTADPFASLGEIEMLITYAVLLLGLATAADSQPIIKRFGHGFTESAVWVDNAALAHTSQLLAVDEATRDLKAEIKNVFDQLTDAFDDHGAAKSDLIKLNVYVVDVDTSTAVMDFLSTWCPVDGKPAVAIVSTALPMGRKFSLDAVFVARRDQDSARVIHRIDTVNAS